MTGICRNRFHSTLTAIAVLTLSLLTGCTILPKTQEVRTFELPSQLPAASRQKPVDWSLRVSTPSAPRLLSGFRIVIQPQPNELAVYKDVRWNSPIPVLVRERILQEFQADNRVPAVSSNELGVHADLELNGTLRAFQNEKGTSNDEIVICLDIQLISTSDQRIIASQRFDVRQPTVKADSQDKSFEQVIQAYGLATDRLAAQVADWTFRQAARQRFTIVRQE